MSYGPWPCSSSSDLLLAHVSTLPAMCFCCEVLSWHSHPTRVGEAETSLPLTKAIAAIVSLRGPRITKETSLAVPVKECLQPNVTVRSAPQTEPRLSPDWKAVSGLSIHLLTPDCGCSVANCLMLLSLRLPCQMGQITSRYKPPIKSAPLCWL